MMRSPRELLNKIAESELNYMQTFIDDGYFPRYADMEAWQLVDKVRKWDFSPMDNLIWHYTRITFLSELVDIMEKYSEEEE